MNQSSSGLSALADQCRSYRGEIWLCGAATYFPAKPKPPQNHISDSRTPNYNVFLDCMIHGALPAAASETFEWVGEMGAPFSRRGGRRLFNRLFGAAQQGVMYFHWFGHTILLGDGGAGFAWPFTIQSRLLSVCVSVKTGSGGLVG